MKKTLIALAVLAASGASFAQSSVSLTGGMTLGFGITDIGTASTGAQLARQTGNVQFAGTEDLGGGLKASFKFQTTLGNNATNTVDTAQAKSRTLLGDRASVLSLSGDFGTVAAGRDNTAVRSLWGAIGDVSQLAVISGLSAGSSAAAPNTDGGYVYTNGGDENARVIYGDTFANAVSYTSPAFNGFQVSVGLVPVNAVTTYIGNDLTNKDTISYSVTYAAGPFAAGYNYTDAKGGTAYSLSTALASYDLGVAKFGVTYQTVDLATGTNPGAGVAITAAVPMGAGNVGFGWGKRSAAAQTGATFGDEVQQSFVGYRYNLSKRTNVQLVWNKIDRAGAATDITEKHVLLAHSF